MARPIRNVIPFLSQYEPSEKQAPTPKTFLVPPKGMDSARRLNLLEPSVSRLIQNFMIRDGVYSTRFGTSQVGDVALTEVVYAAEFVLSNGDSWMVRWREDGVDLLLASIWTPIVDGGLVEADLMTTLAITSWNDTFVFGTQKGKLRVLSFDPAPLITEITDSPLYVKHMCTFNNRILASIGRKLKWCVSRDNLDWSGVGSGEEELLGSPGGKVDQQTATYGISDEIAIAIRSNSIWQVSVTGNFDAPFAFSRIRPGVGSLYPLATCEIPGGVAFLSQDDVVIYDAAQGLQRVGAPIRREILPLSRSYLRRACLVYDEREDELRLSIPDGNQAAHRIYRYNRSEDAWTKDVYQFVVRAASFTRFSQSSLTIDELDQLAGTIDTLPIGTIDDLGVSDRSVGLIFTMEGDSKRIARENDTVGNAGASRDVDSTGLAQPTETRIETAFVFGGTSIEKTHITQVQIGYESEGAATILVEYSDDGGVTWNQYDILTVADTGGKPALVKATLALERNDICIAVSCAQSPNMKLISLHPFTDATAQVVDAS